MINAICKTIRVYITVCSRIMKLHPTHQILRRISHQDTHFPGFNVRKHGLKSGPLEVRAGKTVVGVPAQIGKAVLFCVGFEYPFLR